jgi:hypothetical protein
LLARVRAPRVLTALRAVPHLTNALPRISELLVRIAADPHSDDRVKSAALGLLADVVNNFGPAAKPFLSVRPLMAFVDASLKSEDERMQENARNAAGAIAMLRKL